MSGISSEVKAEILAKVKTGQKVVELSKQYGVSDKTIYNWLQGQETRLVSSSSQLNLGGKISSTCRAKASFCI